jgi:hypothetical protein
MKKLAALVLQVFADRAPLAAVGLPQGAVPGASAFASLTDLPAAADFAGALWAGSLDEAASAAVALRTAVREGGTILLLQVKGHGPFAFVRTWLSGTGGTRGDETVERLCGALLCAGLSQPSLIAESAALTAAMGRVDARHMIS